MKIGRCVWVELPVEFGVVVFLGAVVVVVVPPPVVPPVPPPPVVPPVLPLFCATTEAAAKIVKPAIQIALPMRHLQVTKLYSVARHKTAPEGRGSERAVYVFRENPA